MEHEPQHLSPVFHIDVTADSSQAEQEPVGDCNAQIVFLLRQLVASQERQAKLLEELKQQVTANQRQRNSELAQWKQANPRLARACRAAAESLSQVQASFLETLTEEVNDNADTLIEGEFMLTEFVDRFGPRLAHLNGVLQVLSQLSSVPNPTGASQ